MFEPSSLAPPTTGRSRISKALPSLPPMESFAPLDFMSESRAPAPVPTPPKPRDHSSAFSPVSSSMNAALPPQRAPPETYLHSPLPPLPQPRQQPRPQPAPSSKGPGSQQQAAPTPPPPPMFIPRRPVAKPAAPPQPVPEPYSPSGSLSSLLSAYSRSSGESLIRSSVGDGYADTTANSSSEFAVSPARDDPSEQKKNMFALPPRAASLAPQGEPLYKQTVPPPLPLKDERRPADSQRGEGHGATTNKPAPAPLVAPEGPGVRSQSSPQATSELLVRRTAKSGQTHEVPELKLAFNHSERVSEDSQVLPSLSRTAVSASHASSERPAPPTYSAYTPPYSRDQTPLRTSPPLQQHPQASRQGAEDTMGQKSSRLLRSDGDSHPTGPPSKAEAALPSPLNQQLMPSRQRTDGGSAGVSPSDTETSQGRDQGQVQQPYMHLQPPQMQQQPQQQQRQQQAAPTRKPIGSKAIHEARSLPDMKSVVPQTSSERPPPISPEYGLAQESPLPQQAAQDPPPPAEQKLFPPRTSSTRGPAPPSLDRRVERVASTPNLADYAANPPPNRARRSGDTVYREVNQDDLPPPDPRALYFPKQTQQPGASASASGVFRAPSVSAAHHACFQEHTKMIMSRNKFYPLSCMACEAGDSELRWQCAWCRLRVCGVCMRLLQSHGRDLGRVMEHLETHPHSQRASGAPSAGSAHGSSRPPSSGILAAVEESPEPGPTASARWGPAS